MLKYTNFKSKKKKTVPYLDVIVQYLHYSYVITQRTNNFLSERYIPPTPRPVAHQEEVRRSLRFSFSCYSP